MSLRRWIKNNRGQALVELALVLPILLLILFGIIEFGRVYNSNIIVANSAREGARVGVVGSTDSEIIAKVKETASTLNTSKLTINITPSSSSRVRGASLTVTVQYPVQINTPIISSIVGSTITLSSSSVMRVE